jgi:hypothetical protein
MNKLLGLNAIKSCHWLQVIVAHLKIWKPSIAIFDIWGSTRRWRPGHLSSELPKSIQARIIAMRAAAWNKKKKLRLGVLINSMLRGKKRVVNVRTRWCRRSASPNASAARDQRLTKPEICEVGASGVKPHSRLFPRVKVKMGLFSTSGD